MSTQATLSPHPPNILVVDDMPANLLLLSRMLKDQGYKVRPASSGKLALQAALNSPPDLVLLDINMPEMNGYELCERMKAVDTLAKIPVIFISALNETVDKIKAFGVGGVDYITKPFQFEEVRARVETHLSLRRLQLELERHNRDLQNLVQEQTREIVNSHMATLFALGRLAESRDDNTGTHIRRVQDYCRMLATHLAGVPPLDAQLDAEFIDNLFHAAPLHDIGKVGIPDAVLLKPAKLTPEEIKIMQSHTVIGAATLEEVHLRHPNNEFIRMGMDIARSHHERWDGTGYPDGLAGEAIPLSARILTIADQYDALRNARPYKPSFDHRKCVEILVRGDGRSMPQHFDPNVLQAFQKVAPEFERISGLSSKKAA